MRALAVLALALVRSFLALLRSRQDQALVELALRQQLEVYARRQRRPRLSPLDRAFWVALVRFWPRWKKALVIVQPDTVVRWHREGFRHYWRSISIRGPGRPRLSQETRDLILRLATENGWRARRIQGELSKIGIDVSLSSISRYLPKLGPDPDSQQRWITFLRNHRDVITGMDFFVVPTFRFRLLYVWFALDHGRRRVLSFDVTSSPTARWVNQQLREAFSDAPPHRLLIYGNDAIFCSAITQVIESLGLHPQRTAHYNAERVHSSIADAPQGRAPEAKPYRSARLTRLPRVGGLHGRYVWREAA